MVLCLVPSFAGKECGFCKVQVAAKATASASQWAPPPHSFVSRQRTATRTATLTAVPSPVEGLAREEAKLLTAATSSLGLRQGNLTCKAAFKGAKHSRGLREFIV